MNAAHLARSRGVAVALPWVFGPRGASFLSVEKSAASSPGIKQVETNAVPMRNGMVRARCTRNSDVARIAVRAVSPVLAERIETVGGAAAGDVVREARTVVVLVSANAACDGMGRPCRFAAIACDRPGGSV